MYCPVTLSAEEFRDLHNAICDLDGLDSQRVQDAVARMRDALRGAYDQDQADFDRKSGHYQEVCKELNLDSVWSLHEVADLRQPHPFPDAVQVVYRDHWGPKEICIGIRGSTWADLYRAADQAIAQSGDRHHVFIEAFRPNPQEPRQLMLSTGS